MEIWNKNLIDLNLKAKSKEDVIYELSKLLYENNYIYDIEDFTNDIFKREKLGITGFGHNIAIPHGQSSSVKNIGIAVGRTKNMIEWESLDGEPVNFIFLFCINDDPESSKKHLKMLTEVAKKLANDNFLEKIKLSSNSDEFLKYMEP